MGENRRPYWAGLAIAATLVIGILIGTVVSRGVRAARPAMFAPDAKVLPPPSPVELSNSFAEIAARIEPSVVNINTETTLHLSARHFGPPGEKQPFDDFFNHFFGLPPGHPTDIPQESLGSGVILDPNGYILTNDHVVTRSDEDKPVDKIEVSLHGDDGTNYKARIVGQDKDTDLAVIKIDAGKRLVAATFGDSSGMRIGDWVLAVGSPFGQEGTVTAGIVSGKGRDIEGGQEGQFKRFIQTDAAINPGNSGGPLVNLAGQVIGINTAIATHRYANDGVGFAIPSDTARRVYNAIVSYGYVRRGAIGVTFQGEQNQALLRSFGAEHGVVINGVETGTPAERAGLKMGDVITAIDGREISSGDQLVEIVAGSEIGKRLDVQYLRGGKTRSTTVVVADRSKIVAENRARETAPGTAPSGPANAVGVLGVNVRALTEDQAKDLGAALHLQSPRGVLVTEVHPEGFGADLGVLPGDVILEINHQPVSSLGDFNRLQSVLRPGMDVLLLVARRTGSTFSTFFLADHLQ